MPEKPVKGGTIWTREGIEPANAYWIEAEAYRDALIDLTEKITDAVTPQQRSELQLEMLTIINKQGVSLNYLSRALHVIEVIGLTAKQERLDNGTSQTDAGTR